jgi:hypothetical protein
MLSPFPEAVRVTYGLVNFRTIYQVPVWIFGLLLVAGIAPLYIWGRGKWWVSLGCLALGALVATVAKDDPQFVPAHLGEFGLKDYYD